MPFLMNPIRTRSLLLLFFAGIATGFGPRQVVSGEAFFSADGQTVTMALTRGTAGLVRVDLATGTITDAPLPGELREEYIDSVARGAEGEALFLAKEAVWVWTPGPGGKVVRVCPTAPVTGATDLFVVTAPDTALTDALFVSGVAADDATGMGVFHGRLPGAEAFSPVFCRRVSNAMAGAWTSDGRFFFVSDGDLWEGGILPEEDPEIARLGVLVGARVAPLGVLNTDEGNSGGLWATTLAPAGPWIYVHLRGRHLSTIVRTPVPAKTLYGPATEDFPTVREQLVTMRDALAATEIVADDLGDIRGFCATAVDGVPRVFYCAEGGGEGEGTAMILREGDAAPRVIGYLPRD